MHVSSNETTGCEDALCLPHVIRAIRQWFGRDNAFYRLLCPLQWKERKVARTTAYERKPDAPTGSAQLHPCFKKNGVYGTSGSSSAVHKKIRFAQRACDEKHAFRLCNSARCVARCQPASSRSLELETRVPRTSDVFFTLLAVLQDLYLVLKSF